MFSFLKKKQNVETVNPITVDLHSHLIYGVDDGSETLEQSLSLIQNLKDFGYKKIITTPHIMNDFYKNSKDTLFPKRDIILKELENKNINIPFHVAAEYYLDDGFLKKLKDKDNLLLIENKYLLVETSYINEPINLITLIFEILSAGYTPILALPERYTYLYNDFEKYQEVYDRGVKFQLNINSLSGYYSKGAKDIASKLIENKMIDYACTDCHAQKHLDTLKKSINTKDFKKLLNLDLQNNKLL